MRLMNWQAALKRTVKNAIDLVQNCQILILGLDELWSDQAFRLCDQGHKCTYKHIQWSNWSKDKGIDRIWDPIKEEELSSSPVESPTIKRLFFPLGETNVLESSSSRLEIDERANYKSFLLDFTIKLRSKLVEMELTFSPSLDDVRSLICRSFNEDLLHSTNLDLQSQTQTRNLPQDHYILDYKIRLNTIIHSFTWKYKGESICSFINRRKLT